MAVDADSVDSDLRRIIINACCRKGVNVLFVSDRPLKDVAEAHISHGNICQVVVRTDFDSADDFILLHKDEVLFCITHDRILQDKLQQVGVCVIDKRGNENSVGSAITYRKRTAKDVEAFSNALCRMLDRFVPDASSGGRSGL